MQDTYITCSEPVTEKREGGETRTEGHVPLKLIDDEHGQPHKHHGEQHQHGGSTVGRSEVHQWGCGRKQGVVMSRDMGGWVGTLWEAHTVHLQGKSQKTTWGLHTICMPHSCHVGALEPVSAPAWSSWPVQEGQCSQTTWIEGRLHHGLGVRSWANYFSLMHLMGWDESNGTYPIGFCQDQMSQCM